MKFKKKGKNISISKNVKIIGAKNISIGNNVRIDDFTIISCQNGKLYIGSNVHLAGLCYLGCTGNIFIGNNVNIAQGVKIYSKSDNYLEKKTKRKFTIKPIKIGNNVIIGSNTVVIPGAHIENNCRVGALSLVKNKLKKNSLYSGIPAVFQKKLK
jgi:galactoside O-acetyltransferase